MTMNIGQAAAASGVTPKMIRHYEALGLLPAAPRSDAGYRRYDERALHALRFIRRARDLGFGLDEIAGLLALWGNHGRASAEVKALAERHVADLQARIERMQAMQRTLRRLVQACHGDDRPDCPILDDLAGGGTATGGSGGTDGGADGGAGCRTGSGAARRLNAGGAGSRRRATARRAA